MLLHVHVSLGHSDTPPLWILNMFVISVTYCFPTRFIIKCFTRHKNRKSHYNNCTFSRFSAICLEQPSQTIKAYSCIRLVNVIYKCKLSLKLALWQRRRKQADRQRGGRRRDSGKTRGLEASSLYSALQQLRFITEALEMRIHFKSPVVATTFNSGFQCLYGFKKKIIYPFISSVLNICMSLQRKKSILVKLKQLAVLSKGICDFIYTFMYVKML